MCTTDLTARHQSVLGCIWLVNLKWQTRANLLALHFNTKIGSSMSRNLHGLCSKHSYNCANDLLYIMPTPKVEGRAEIGPLHLARQVKLELNGK